MRRVTYPLRRWPRVSVAAIAGAVVLGLVVMGANAYLVLSTRGEATGDVGEVPRAQVAIVPGAGVNPDGTMSTMLADRVRQAARLWHAGKVEKVLVSGDHGSWVYDEPDTMRKALVADGATMVRAKSIFGVRDAVVVTQGFHMPRALYLADEAGIEATGLTADLHPYGIQGVKSDVREALSRVKAIADVTLQTPAMAGPRIPIDSADGRESWGPPPPAGTPPAGSPGR
jgi:SanA protein